LASQFAVDVAGQPSLTFVGMCTLPGTDRSRTPLNPVAARWFPYSAITRTADLRLRWRCMRRWQMPY